MGRPGSSKVVMNLLLREYDEEGRLLKRQMIPLSVSRSDTLEDVLKKLGLPSDQHTISQFYVVDAGGHPHLYPRDTKVGDLEEHLREGSPLCLDVTRYVGTRRCPRRWT